MEIVVFWHGGFLCGLPATQTANAEPQAGEDGCIVLWDISGSSNPRTSAERFLRVATAAGQRHLRCREVRLVRVDHDACKPLPEFIRELMGLPHVIGLVTIGETLGWMVDMNFFPIERVETSAHVRDS